MSKFFKRLLPLLLIFFFLFGQIVMAVSEEECKGKGDLSQKISCLGTLLKENEQKRASLQGEITKFNTRIALTTAQITQTGKQIEELEKQIAELSVKITRLDRSLDELSLILVNRIAETYKKGNIDSVLLLLSSHDVGEFVNRYKYLRIIQLNDRRLMLQMETTRTSYDDQKHLKEEKQQQLSEAKKKLELQNQLLAQQKADKENLLVITQNDEKRYQSLLAAARAEQEAILSVIRQSLSLLKDGTPVEQGKEIALMGNSGSPCCSTGEHLHFEIRKDVVAQDPASYLKSRDVIWNNSPDGPFTFGGDWDWPIDNPRITQGFGMTHYARIGYYGGNPHSGLDIVGSPSVIKAPRSGTLYKGQTTCGRGCPINYVAIDHGGGLISWYWHVQ